MQLLFTLNSPMVMAASTAFAARLAKESPGDDPAPRIQRAYRLGYGRPATAAQVQRAITFLSHNHPGGKIDEAAWREFAQVILGSNEFQFVD